MRIFLLIFALQPISCWASENSEHRGYKQIRDPIFTKKEVRHWLTEKLSSKQKNSETDQKVETEKKRSVSEFERKTATKDERDTQYFWLLYNGVCEGRAYGRDHIAKLLTQIELAVQDNEHILQSGQSATLVKKNDLVLTPLRALAGLHCAVPGRYAATFLKLWERDTDTCRRQEVLRFFISNSQAETVQELIKKGADVSNAKLIVNLILCCCLQSTTRAPTFFESSSPYQLKRLEMAQTLVEARTPLSEINDTFPPASHAAKCVSCLYLRNQAAYQRERAEESLLTPQPKPAQACVPLPYVSQYGHVA